MNKTQFACFISVALVVGVVRLSPAAETHKQKQEQSEVPSSNAQEAVNIGNEICPSSGEKIDEKMKATYEYKGKIYNFCCASCIDEFKKGPEKYIKKVEEELNMAAKEAPTEK